MYCMRQHRLVPVRHVAVRVDGGGGAALAAMADGATESLEGVLLVQRMVAQRLRVTAVAGVFHRQMAGGAAVHPVEVGQDDLADFNGDAFGQQPLLAAWRRGGFPPGCICAGNPSIPRYSSR